MTSVAIADTQISHRFASPLGDITIELDGDKLSTITIHDDHAVSTTPVPSHPMLVEIINQLEEYFDGRRREFDVPLALEGTAFQQDIWQALLEIPYGQTLSYGELGAAAGHPGSARAVGGAVGANPVPMIVPCHRVMGKDGSITGYSGGSGIPTKQWLLKREQTA